MKLNKLTKTFLACSISFALAAPISVSANNKNLPSITHLQKQTNELSTTVSFEDLGINKQSPRFNANFPLTFLDELGYVPLNELLIQPKGRNPFSTENVIKGYFLVKNWKPQKNDLGFLAKVTNIKTQNTETSLDEPIAKLAFLANNKQALLGEFYSVILLNEWVQKDKKAGNTRVNSTLNKAREYFEKQNRSRQNSDTTSSETLNGFYRQALQMLPIELQSDLNTQYYFKSILFQDFETQQVTETLLSNHHSAEDIGQINAAADVLVASMKEAKFAVQINNTYKSKIHYDLGSVNTSFAGEYGRTLLAHEQPISNLIDNTGVVITVDKEKINHYFISILDPQGQEVQKFSAKLSLNGRGLDIDETGSYLTFMDDATLRIFYNPDDLQTSRIMAKGYYADFVKGVKFDNAKNFDFIPKPTNDKPFKIAKDFKERFHPVYISYLWISSLNGHGDLKKDDYSYAVADYENMPFSKLKYSINTFRDMRCKEELCVSPEYSLSINEKQWNEPYSFMFPLNHGLIAKLTFSAKEDGLFYLTETEIPLTNGEKAYIQLKHKGAYEEPQQSIKGFIDGVNFLNEYITVLGDETITEDNLKEQFTKYRAEIKKNKQGN